MPRGTSTKQSGSPQAPAAKHSGHSAPAPSGSGPSLITRQEVRGLGAADLQDYRDGIRQMQAISDNRGFQVIAGYHGIPGHHCWHHKPLFLPWHRAYLYHFEQFLRDRVSNTAIPWWNWSSGPSHASGIPQAFTDANGSDAKPNPLLKFSVNLPASRPPIVGDTKRAPQSPADLPATADVSDALSREDFLDFSQAVEQIHDNVHGWTGGDMGLIPQAAFDPIFYSHHCMIDRIWYLWQIKNGQNNIPGNMLSEALVPFGLTVADVLDITHLGYQYAVSRISG